MPDLFLSKAKVLFPIFFLLDLGQEIYRAAFFKGIAVAMAEKNNDE